MKGTHQVRRTETHFTQNFMLHNEQLNNRWKFSSLALYLSGRSKLWHWRNKGRVISPTLSCYWQTYIFFSWTMTKTKLEQEGNTAHIHKRIQDKKNNRVEEPDVRQSSKWIVADLHEKCSNRSNFSEQKKTEQKSSQCCSLQEQPKSI